MSFTRNKRPVINDCNVVAADEEKSTYSPPYIAGVLTLQREHQLRALATVKLKCGQVLKLSIGVSLRK